MWWIAPPIQSEKADPEQKDFGSRCRSDKEKPDRSLHIMPSPPAFLL
jgi:hypothetical protein